MYFYLFIMLIMFTVLLTIIMYIKSLDISGFCLHCKSVPFSLEAPGVWGHSFSGFFSPLTFQILCCFVPLVDQVVNIVYLKNFGARQNDAQWALWCLIYYEILYLHTPHTFQFVKCWRQKASDVWSDPSLVISSETLRLKDLLVQGASKPCLLPRCSHRPVTGSLHLHLSWVWSWSRAVHFRSSWFPGLHQHKLYPYAGLVTSYSHPMNT